MESYRTVRKEGCGEYEVKRSRFLCYAAPVRSQDEAAAFIASIKQKHWDARHNCSAYILLILAVTCALVYKENHVSGTLLIFALGVMMMFLAGFNYRWFVIGAVAAVVLVIVVINNPSILPEHAQPRILSWVDKSYDPLGVRWQTNQAIYAIGSGGFFGVGLGNSKMKQLYVSEPQNDFIFSIICEELGFVGALFIVILFALLVWRGFLIGIKAKVPSPTPTNPVPFSSASPRRPGSKKASSSRTRCSSAQAATGSKTSRTTAPTAEATVPRTSRRPS